jgi:hypothetical protein
MKTENIAAQAAQTGNGGENAGKSSVNALTAKTLSGLVKRRIQPERYVQYALKFIGKY